MRLAAALLLAGLMTTCRAGERTSDSPPPAAATPAAAAAASAAEAPAVEKIVGRWLRSDADYTIEIVSVGADGKLDARYLNPGPIHVSRAESAMAGGALRVLVELQDRGYPGSYYTLTYDPGSDSLTGIYHHLGLNQQFEVAFSRVSTTS
jgi:uncharacterized protein (DUF2147 family)